MNTSLPLCCNKGKLMYLEQPLLPDIALTAEPYEFPSFVIGTKYIF